MKKRLAEKMKQFLALSVILGCLLCSFYLCLEELPSSLGPTEPWETQGYLSGLETELKVENARELSSDLSRTAYIRQDSFKKQSILSGRLYMAMYLCLTAVMLAILTYRTHSVKTVLHSHNSLMNYIHDQDGEK